MAELENKQDLSDNKEIEVDVSTISTLNFCTHIIQRRRPLSLARSPNNIYVTHKGNYKAQLNRCEKLFDSGESEIIIHGLGKAINRACILALQLQKNHHGILDLKIDTSTVELTDDIQPLADDYDEDSISIKNKSAIHIKVYKTVEIGPLKYAK